MWMLSRCNSFHARRACPTIAYRQVAGAGHGSGSAGMVRLPGSRGPGFLVRHRRSDEHVHLLGAAVVRLAEGQPGILVQLLPPGGRSVLPPDLRFVGISPAAVPDCGAGIACGELRAAGPGGVAAYGIALGSAGGLIAGRNQPLIRVRIFQYGDHLRHSGVYVLLERIRIVRALSPGGAAARMGWSGAGVLPVRGGAHPDGAKAVAAGNWRGRAGAGVIGRAAAQAH